MRTWTTCEDLALYPSLGRVSTFISTDGHEVTSERHLVVSGETVLVHLTSFSRFPFFFVFHLLSVQRCVAAICMIRATLF
jgi:hypothetical protein